MPWWVYVIIALVALVILIVIANKINRAFLRRYGVSLFVGGFFALLAAGCIAGGIFLVAGESAIGWGLVGLGAVILLIVAVFDFKRCGFGAGLLAILLQIIFCAPSILLVVDLIFNRGRSTFGSRVKASRAHTEYLAGRRREEE